MDGTPYNLLILRATNLRGIGITPDLLYLGTMHGMVYAFSSEHR